MADSDPPAHVRHATLTDTIFTVESDGRYRLAVPSASVELLIDRLRISSHELHGELTASCGLSGARTFGDSSILSIGNFNLSAPNARRDRAKLLAEASRTVGKLDWAGFLEELCQRVLEQERRGKPPVILPTLPVPPRSTVYSIHGWRLLANDLTILFGDGAAGKSWLALWAAAELARSGHTVAYLDWELHAEAQRHRLDMLYSEPPSHSTLLYVDCDRPMTQLVDSLQRMIRREGVTYVVMDSVGFATEGAPESAESSLGFSRAFRRLGVAGGLALAHINRSEQSEKDRKPFGSVFYHNAARLTWFAQAEQDPAPDGFGVGLKCRKHNNGPKFPDVGFQFTFTDHHLSIRPVNPAILEPDRADGIASKTSIWQRVLAVVQRQGPSTLVELHKTMPDQKVESIDRIVRVRKDLFTRVDGRDGVSRVALLDLPTRGRIQ